MNRKIIVSTILMGILAFSGYAGAIEETISVSGSAGIKVKPDVAYITLYAQADGILMTDAVEKEDKLINEITSAIKTQTKTGIIRDIAVTDLGQGEERQQYYSSSQRDMAPRPQVTRRIRVSCKPVPESLYKIIDDGIRAGAVMQIPSNTSYSNDIRSAVIYGLEHSTEAIEQARAAAMKNAKDEAKKLADLAGKTVGNVVSIGMSRSTQYNMNMIVMGRRADFPTEYVDTNPEEITISESVMVTFELKD